jgi:type I restriction enzyme S subunit
LKQQHAISDYLDRETTKIDALIAAKERLLEILAEKRRAIITHAVTRGLNPNAPLRDSAIPWLGQIPKHWETRRMKYLFTLIAERAPEDNDFELLSLYTDIGVKPRRELEERGNKASTTDDYWMVRRGDLIVNKLLAWMGAFGVSEYDGVTSPAYDILRPTSDIDSFYYHHLFRCGICLPEIKRRSYGVMDMRLRLYFDRFGDMCVPVPPLKEQRAILAHIKTEAAQLDTLRAAAERTIGLLKERRAALITEAVTGKIAVQSEELL